MGGGIELVCYELGDEIVECCIYFVCFGGEPFVDEYDDVGVDFGEFW